MPRKSTSNANHLKDSISILINGNKNQTHVNHLAPSVTTTENELTTLRKAYDVQSELLKMYMEKVCKAHSLSDEDICKHTKTCPFKESINHTKP